MFLSIGIAAALRQGAGHQMDVNVQTPPENPAVLIFHQGSKIDTKLDGSKRTNTRYPRVLICTNPSSGGNLGETYLDVEAANGLIEDDEIQTVHRNVYVAPMILKDNSNQEKACGDKAKELSNESDKLLVIAAGGDSTVQWVIDEVSNKVTIDNERIKQRVVFGILPLGTGNDGSQGLGWGQTSQPSELPKYLGWWLNSSKEKGIYSRALKVYINGALLEPIPNGHRVTMVREKDTYIVKQKNGKFYRDEHIEMNEKSFKEVSPPNFEQIKNQQQNWHTDAQTVQKGPWKKTLVDEKERYVTQANLLLTKNFLWHTSVGLFEKVGYTSQVEEMSIWEKLKLFLARVINNTAKVAIKNVKMGNPPAAVPQKIIDTRLSSSVVVLCGRTFAGGMALRNNNEEQRSLATNMMVIRTLDSKDMKQKQAAVAGDYRKLVFPSWKAGLLGHNNQVEINFKLNAKNVYMQVDGEFVAMLAPRRMTIHKTKMFTFLAKI